MKRFLTLTLAAALITGLTACGQENRYPESAPADTAQTGNAELGNDAAEKPDTEKTSDFEEMIAVDNDECLIKLTDFHNDDLFGCTVGVHIENKSAEKNYMFSAETGALNNIQVDPYWASELGKGETYDDDLTVSNERLEEIGIAFEDITDMELHFRVYDSDDYSAAVAEETVHIYPYGKDKATVFAREPRADDVVIFDTPEASMTVIGYAHDDFWGYEALTYLVNKTDSEIMFSIDEAYLNDIEADPYYAETVSAGKCTFSRLSWDDSVLENNGIKTIDKITLKATAYDSQDLSKDYYVKEQEATLDPPPVDMSVSAEDK